MSLLVIDREKARSLFSAAASSDASVLGEIGHLLSDYPAESSHALVVSAQLEARLAAAPDDATILSFHANRAVRLRNHDVAVQLPLRSCEGRLLDSIGVVVSARAGSALIGVKASQVSCGRGSAR
jgi:hypothetical protein